MNKVLVFIKTHGTRSASFSCYQHLERSEQKLLFNPMISEQKFYILHYACYYNGTFPHSYVQLRNLAHESKFRIKTIPAQTLSEILITSAVICKQRLLLENEIVQYFQNYKYQDVNQGQFRKPSRASTKAVKNNYPKTAHTFFTGRSIFSYFLSLNSYNFQDALTKSVKLHFL